jgi:hypothetical protein
MTFPQDSEIRPVTLRLSAGGELQLSYAVAAALAALLRDLTDRLERQLGATRRAS